MEATDLRQAWEIVARCTGDLVSVVDADGRTVYASPNHATLLGFHPLTLAGGLDPSWVHPDDRAQVWGRMQRLLADEASGAITYRVVARDGRVLWICSHAGAFRTADGTVRVLAVGQDVTAQVEAEQTLRESQQKYRMLAEGASDVLWVMGPDLKTRYMSPAIEAHLGFTVDEYLAMPVEDRLPPESVKVMRDVFAVEHPRAIALATQKKPHSFTFEMRHRHKDGHLMWGEIQAAFLYDGAWNITGIHGVTRNIDRRKQAEDELARREAYYRRLFQEIRAASAVCDVIRDEAGRLVDFVYREVNPAYQVHTGLPPERVVGHRGSEIFSAEELARRLLTLGPVMEGRVLRDECHVATLGRWFDATFWALSRDSFVLMFEDVTTRRRMEEEVARSQKLESVGLLAGGIAHDFNNILTGILGNISLVRMLATEDSRLQPLLESAEEGCGRARDLTQQLLTFSRGGDPVKADLPLPDVIRKAADFVLAGSNVSCTYRFAPRGLTAPMDRGQISQVVQNLVLNAIQSMPAGGRLEIAADRVDLSEGSVPTLPAGPCLRFSVRDEGHGIRDEHLPMLFDPYFTTRPDGQGLGLPVSHSIIRKHGGAILVETQVGLGTTFTVYLPALPGDATRARPDRPAHEPLRRGRVLLMDDDASVREVMGRMLTLLGYEAASVRDGAEAVRMYERHLQQNARFDVVLMDLTVPGGMGGKAAVREILALDPTARAIVMSGYSNDPVMADHAAHGFRGVLPKPVRMSDVRDVITQVLDPAG